MGWFLGAILPPAGECVLGYYGSWPKGPNKFVIVRHDTVLGWIDERRGQMLPGLTAWKYLEGPYERP